MKEDNEMTERLEKALDELNDLMKEVNELKKDEGGEDFSEAPAEEAVEEEAPAPDIEAMDNDDDDEKEASDYSDEEQKMRTGPEGPVEHGFGEDLAAGQKHSQAGQVGQLYKEWNNKDFATLDLSVENVEKAYDAFKAEQLEKMAYDSLKTKFAERFAEEQNVRKADVARSEYDAKNEVETLKEEFASLRKSLTQQSDEIVKAQTVEVPDFDVSDMSWTDIHNVISQFEE